MDRLRAKKSASFDDFTSLVHQLIKVAWGTEWGTFVQAFPNGRESDDVDLPIITYHSKRKRPGVVGNGTTEIKPRFRETYNVTENGKTSAVNVYAQRFDHDVLFEIWAENNVEADKLAVKFEDFMMTYTGYFMQNGVQQIIFLEQTDQTDVMEWKDGGICRSFKYLVRLEKHLEIHQGLITEIIGKVEALYANDLPNDSIDQESINFKITEGGNTQ